MAQTQDAVLLRDAVAAAKQGNKPAARQMLRQASVHNPNNELVWLWRASLSESPKEAVVYLSEVLRINPNNQKASAWLEKCRPHQARSASLSPAAASSPSGAPPTAAPAAYPAFPNASSSHPTPSGAPGGVTSFSAHPQASPARDALRQDAPKAEPSVPGAGPAGSQPPGFQANGAGTSSSGGNGASTAASAPPVSHSAAPSAPLSAVSSPVAKEEPRRQTIPFSGSAPPPGLAGSAGLQNLARGVETGARTKPVETGARPEASAFGHLRPAGDAGIHAPNVAFATPRSPEPVRAPDAMKNRPTVVPFTRTSPAPAIAIASQPSAKWRCPFCQHSADAPARKCPSCRAITVLEDLKEVERNEGVVERLVRDAIGKLQRVPADKREFEHHLHLALAHLNLREASAAIPHLKAAVSAKRNDWALMGILDQIQWRKVVMVVDDSLTVRKALSSTLEKNDYRVELAEDGSQALSKLNDTIPDLVLLDITMPGMDGYQVCRTIKEKALTRKVPVIMLSGKDGLFDKVRGKLAGANDYITKPFQTDHLLKTLKKYLP